MAYLQEIAKHWQHSIQLARFANANDLQLQCMRDLAKSEFGYASDMRLRRECFWHTRVDKDGDVVLTFLEPIELGRNSAHVNVYIDHLAMISTKDMITGEVIMFDAHAERLKWGSEGGEPLIWILDNRLMLRFTERSLAMRDDICTVAETRQVLAPTFSIEEDMVRSTMLRTGDGLFKLGDVLHYGRIIHVDDVSRQRIFALYEIPFFERQRLRLKLFDGVRKGHAAGELPGFRVEWVDAEPVAYCVM